MKRKQFLQTTGAAMLGTVLLQNKSLSFLSGWPKDHEMGLQLFTFFNVIDSDVEGTLKKIAEVGYKKIESAFSRKGGYYGMKPKEFSKFLKDNGMKWKSHHVLGAPFKMPANAKPPVDADGKPVTIPPMRNLRDNMQELIDEVAEGEVDYLVCASTPIGTLDEIKSSIEVLNKADEACKKTKVKFAYHNHDAEFRAVEGQIPYEMFLSQTKMQMELDLAWSTKGGKDPVELFKQHPGRFPLWHVKDIDKEFKTVLPVGEGSIDFKRIFAAADSSGMKHFFIEHDMPKDPLASITSSYNYLSKMLSA